MQPIPIFALARPTSPDSDATATPNVFDTHRPRQRKAAVTAGAAPSRADLALMICVRFRADPARSVSSVNGPLGSAQTGIEPCKSSLPPNA